MLSVANKLSFGLLTSLSKRFLLNLYEGAAAAYSLQRLSSDTTNVVRARRSTDDAEADFTAQEVSGGSLRNFSLNNDADLIRFADQATAADKRMYFDGVNDYVSVAGMTAAVDYFGACTIAATTYIPDPSATKVLCSLGMDAYSVFIAAGNWFVGAGTNTGVAVTAGFNSVAVDYNSTGAAIELRVNGATVWTGTAAGGTAGTTFLIGQRNSANYWKGFIYDFSLSGSSVKNFAFNGYGNTSADWEDQVGSNDGTVVGSPALFSGQGFDAFVTTLYDQSGNGRNALQSTASSQPQIVADGVVVTDSNGNPAITHQLEDSDVGLDFPIPVRNTYFEAYITYQAAASQLQGMLMSDNTNASGVLGVVQDGSASPPRANVTSDTYRKNGAAISSPSRDDLHTQYHDGAINLVTTHATINDNAIWDGDEIAFLRYGGSTSEFSALCIFGEIVVYASDQSANRAAIEANIASRYGITLA